VQNLLVEQLQDASGQLQYRLVRQQQLDGQLQQQEFSAGDLPSLMAQFSAALASELSAQYAVNLNQQAAVTTEGQLELTIAGLTSLTDVVQVQKIFSSMLTVRQHQLVSFSQDQAVIALQLTATEADFYRALALEKKLQPEQAPAATGAVPDASQTSASEPGATAPGTIETKIEETTDNAASGLTAAEQAMEQALGTEEATVASTEAAASEQQFTPEQTTGAVSSSGTVANSGTVTAVVSTHYRYIKP